MHALTHARTVVRARGQTDRDKEHFRRCTGRPRSAYLLLLARRGRRTRGRVTPECPRFLLSVPSPSLPRSPVVSPGLPSLSGPCSLYRRLVRLSSSLYGLLPVPGVRYLLFFPFFPFFSSLSLSLSFTSLSLSLSPAFLLAPLARKCRAPSRSTRYPARLVNPVR